MRIDTYEQDAMLADRYGDRLERALRWQQEKRQKERRQAKLEKERRRAAEPFNPPRLINYKLGK